MDVRQLEYFLAVVDHGSVSKAATALYVAQPSLSQAIRVLERDLRQPLFHRIGRRHVLTDVGRVLIEPARQVEIAAMPSKAVEPLAGMIQRFTERHQGMSVSVRAAFTAGAVIDQVRGGQAELGLLAATELPKADLTNRTPRSCR